MSLYSILGGKLDLIKQESYLERYIQNSIPFDPKQNPSRKLSYYALKPTRGNKTEKQVSDVKGKVSMFKDNLEQYQSLKELRVSLERMRILCSQVSKRENIKTKLEALNNKITNKNLDTGKKLVITPGPKARRAPIIDIEPPVIKKRKRGRPPKSATKSAPTSPPESESEFEEEEAEAGEEEEEEESFSEEEEEESLLKKKLNRKKKEIERNNKAKVSKYIKTAKGKQNQGEPPRKRGRPRKYPLPEEVEEEYEDAEEDLYSPEYDEDEEGEVEGDEEEEEEQSEEYDEEGSEENESETSGEDDQGEEEEEDYEDEEGDEYEEDDENSEGNSEENSEEPESESEVEDERMKERNRKAKLIQDKIQEMRKLNKGKPRRGRPPKISNPNEPRDFDEQDDKPKKPYRLKKELQKILIHQNVNQFEVFARTPNSKRATRSSSSKQKNRKIR